MKSVRVEVDPEIELDRLRAQLFRSERLANIGELAAGIAHEVNNPVGYVQSNLQTLSGYVQDLLVLIEAYRDVADADAPDPDARARLDALREHMDEKHLLADLPDVVEESRQGVEIIRDVALALKDFARPPDTVFEARDINALIRQAARIAANEIKYVADLEFNLTALPPVTCVGSMISQVLLNLLVNAAHAMEERGRITITTALEEAGVTVSVADTGRGMNVDVAARIFEPFFTTKPAGRGTGLGLSLVDDIIARHEGRINVQSEVGRGTVFHLWLPLGGPQPGQAGRRTYSNNDR
ncbi:MAG: ATP-binding protein [Aquisalimonadaceae bacterium]